MSHQGSPPYFFKVTNEYGHEIRNNGYSEHVISIGRSTEKIKDCLSVLISKRQNSKCVQKKRGIDKATSKDPDFI